MPNPEVLKVICFVPPAIQVIADRRGLLKARGIETQVSLTASSDEQFRALSELRCDAAVTAMDNVIGWNRRVGGGDFLIVAQVETTTPLSVFARSELTSLSELIDRNILVDSTENGFVVVLRAMLADAGVDVRANRIIAAGGVKERFEKLLSGQGDAALLGPPYDGLALGAGLRRLASANELYPALPGQGIIIRRSALTRRQTVIANWLQALEEGRIQCRADSARAQADMMATGFAQPGAQALVAGVGPTLRPDRPGIELLLSLRTRAGFPGGDVRFEELVDSRLVP